MKYFVDLHNDNTFDLVSIEDRETVFTGNLDDIGIEENDEQFSNKLDDFFETLGIKPNEWEIG